jgi:hypothetical protein
MQGLFNPRHNTSVMATAMYFEVITQYDFSALRQRPEYLKHMYTSHPTAVNILITKLIKKSGTEGMHVRNFQESVQN